MRTVTALLIAAGLTGLMVVGCGPKVDCDKLHDKLTDCTKHLMWKLRPTAKRNFDEATKATADPKAKKAAEDTLAANVLRNQETLKKQVTEKCKAKKGRAADAKLINKCLQHKTCPKFAECFSVYLKAKSK